MAHARAGLERSHLSREDEESLAIDHEAIVIPTKIVLARLQEVRNTA